MSFRMRRGRASFSVGKRGPRASYRLGCALPLALVLLMGCSSLGIVDPADAPPPGTVWFGDSFDTDTFAIRNRKTSVGTTETFAAVATLTRSVNAGEVNIRVSWNGQVVTNQQANFAGSGEYLGFTFGPLFEPGDWRYEFTDIGGNVLAAGTITAR